MPEPAPFTSTCPKPAISQLRDFRAELYYEGPMEDALTVSKKVEMYIRTFF